MAAPKGYRSRSASPPTRNGGDSPEELDPDSPLDTGIESDTASSTANGADRRRAPAGRPRKGPSKPLDVVRADLVQLYTGVGLLLKPMLPLPALVVVRQSEECADAWIRAAEVNPIIRRALEGFTQASVYGALIMAHAPIAIAVQVQMGNMPIEHPMAQSIRPEIELVIAENARRAEAAAQEAAAAPAE